MDPKFANRLYKHTNLTDILIQFEDFLDGLDLYVFENWFKGSILKGPEIRRYWVDVTLRYDYEHMPDPQGALRLQKHGAKVKYEKVLEKVPVEVEKQAETGVSNPQKPEVEEAPFWNINISIPRKFIAELDDDDLELYDDDINTDDVSDARDENVDQVDAFKDGGK